MDYYMAPTYRTYDVWLLYIQNVEDMGAISACDTLPLWHFALKQSAMSCLQRRVEMFLLNF